MLSAKDLLTKHIKVHYKDNKAGIKLPLNLERIQTVRRPHKGLFSPSIFKESLHSNRLALGIVSFGNALIMIIIIAILSTLHINSTSTALKDLFNNADTENTVKSGAISLYTSYSTTAKAYQTFVDAADQVEMVVDTSLDMVNKDTDIGGKVDTGLTTLKEAFDVAEKLPNKGESEAKDIAMQGLDAILSNSTDYTDTEKAAVRAVYSYCLDEYMVDKTQNNQSLLIKAVPSGIRDTAKDTMNLTDENADTMKSYLSSAINRVYNESATKEYVVTETGFALIRALSSGELKDVVNTLVDDLEETYMKDKPAYVADNKIRNNTVSSSCINYVMKTLDDFAYYQYLPNFTVNYKTNELGYPVKIVTNYDAEGNPYEETIPMKEYKPEEFAPVAEKMGTRSNILQKMHKDLLTGEDYTKDEVSKAKDDAKESVEMIKSHLNSFMSEFRLRINGVNDYYDGVTINDESIVNKAEDEISEIAEKTLIDYYNEKNDTNISSIDEISLEDNAMSGEEMLTTVKGFASGGISSYKLYAREAEKKGYSTKDTMLFALTKGSQGVIAQLPVAVDDSLQEMGEMNVYGVIIGMVAFGIAALLIPMVYTILLSKSLVSEKIETGSLAFTLSTPITRDAYIFTEALYLIFSETVMAASLLVATLLTRQIGIWCGSQDLIDSLPISHVLYYCLGNYMVTLAVSGINFLASCHFNKTNQAIGTGGGLTIFFFICSILGLFGTKAIPGTIRIEAMNIFNYLTIDSLFDALAVMQGRMVTYWWKLFALLAITLVTYVAGAINFKKKDLPL